jgi:phosphoribosylanthranilate isomerase
LFNGLVSNIKRENIEAWMETIATLKPELVQIYSTTRPTAQDEIRCLSLCDLQQIQELIVEKTSLSVIAY